MKFASCEQFQSSTFISQTCVCASSVHKNFKIYLERNGEAMDALY